MGTVRPGMRFFTTMKLAGLAAAISMLCAGCVTVESNAPPTPEPWIVTSVQIGSGAVFTIEYTRPGGGTGSWTVPVGDLVEAGQEEARDCFLEAEVGQALPVCARSMQMIFDAVAP